MGITHFDEAERVERRVGHLQATWTKLGEAAGRLSKLDVLAPAGVDWALAIANRNFIIHRYDEIDREQTWLTLSSDLPAWRASLASLFTQAETALTTAEAENADPA